ncbi:hypothetical protein M9H77_05918 [Catharanthus roseus]|uniref:Uncharacterized protein n=1 Tax=Catharanthus roseus TaxID=4058 RepID=A0ACC0BR15_CATRO|nr:hypothetical protein M9H77_05918 [Catharanthus roseus]
MLVPPPPPPPPPSSSQQAEITSTATSNSVNNLFRGIFSYDGNIMLAAIISLLLVILFVLLLHIYAKWFLNQARQRSRRSVSVPQVLGPRLNHHFHNSFTIDTTFAESPTKGLESWVISEIPLFLYKLDDDQVKQFGLIECAICLSLFEDQEMGRRLPKCGHVFHVECIDMWLNSHSTCPICRASVLVQNQNQTGDLSSLLNNEVTVLDFDVNQESSASSVDQEQRNDHDHDQDSILEIIVEVPNLENENVNIKDSLSPSSASSHGRPFLCDSIKKIIEEQI